MKFCKYGLYLDRLLGGEEEKVEKLEVNTVHMDLDKRVVNTLLKYQVNTQVKNKE